MKKLIVFALLFVLVSLAFSQVPDLAKHPHYFGPYPNWANSPWTGVDANIQLTDTCGGGAGTGATAVAQVNSSGAITAILVTSQGTGYTCAPDLSIVSANGTGATAHATYTPSPGYVSSITLVNGGSNYFSPLVTINGNGTGATADATVDPYSGAITGITITNPGSNYTTVAVDIQDLGGTGTGASATAAIAGYVIGAIVDAAGSGYRTTGGIRKFVDGLPGLGPSGANNLGQYVSLAHPDTTTYPGSDYYEIAVVEYSKKLHSDLLPTRLRGYVQLNNGTDANGQNTIVPDAPQYLGATIIASKDRPVRILFRNQLPTGAQGNLFLPVDTSLMGAGMGPGMGGMQPTDQGTVFDEVRNPMCGAVPKPANCFTENRATLHLHGGTTPWISDGTPHQWTAPAGEVSYPDGGSKPNKGVSVSYVPDMWFDATGNTITSCAGQPACGQQDATNDPGPGALTFYYTNQQSARLLFYHDHAWGITRLNVYAGEAAGYLITDSTEQGLIAPGGPLDATDPALGYGIPLVIQDRTFVPNAAQLAVQDPTWDPVRWGTEGNFWYHHVYMTAQNPADPTGVSPYGRWMYGPWFWPPSNNTPYQPIPNPWYDPACDPLTAPNGFCEPPQIPGTPNISVGMEQFNDTPMVNGTPYPTVTLEPKAYRFRILSAANDRFFNLQWYVADSSGTEVALKAAEVAAAQNDPNVYPTPDTTLSPVGPSWLQIGSEGGFLPTPVTVPNQTITWITDPTRFDFGNVDKHSLLVAPAERADVIVDFSRFAGKTLILYNDAPAAFPARQASYDYYTGDPDNTDIGGAPSTVAGFGPNTRTIMQVTVAGSVTTPSAFSLSKLVSAFQHNAGGTGVFESGQNPIVVGQAGYNRAYGTSFTASGDCSNPATTTKCDGFARINQQGGDPFTFDTLNGAKISLTLQPKALHDEMNSTTFDEYGRMQATMGVEAVPATANAQNVVLYPYINPATEIIDASALPSGLSLTVTPIATATDGTQIWKVTHNGVDTHPIHFHLFDVQVINRVTWDNIIIPPDLNELGWKDTVRISPLEDTLVAIRPIVPALPFEIPNSVRPLNPMMPLGSTLGFNSTDPNANPSAQITNELVNFGWEYVWHCHILSHEEMDMMRAVILAVPAKAPVLTAVVPSPGGVVNLSWTESSRLDSFTGFTLYRSTDPTLATGKTTLATFAPAASGTYIDNLAPGDTTVYYYGVAVDNVVGYGTHDPAFPQLDAAAMSNIVNSLPNAIPVAGLSPATLAFGNTLVGASTTQLANGTQAMVTVSNSGNGDLIIASMLVTGTADFTYAPACTTITPGGTCTFTVTFTPTVLGPVAGTLTLTTNDPAHPSLTVSLTGAGIVNTTTTVTAPAIIYGADGIVTVDVASSPTGFTPAGTVTLSVDGGAPISAALTGGSATFTLTAPAAGSHTLAANYAAQSMFQASSGNGTLNVAAASLTITASSDTMTYGGAVPTITPSFSPTNPVLTTQPTCSTTATSASPAGSYPSACTGAVEANYAINYVDGTVTVNKASTNTAINTNGPSPSIIGQIVTISFSVTPQFLGVPTGNVTVTASTGETCTGALNGGGAGNCTIIFNTGGSRTLTASYAGDGNFLASGPSAAKTQQVSNLSLSTLSLLFGNQLVGTTSASQAVTLTNVGTTTITISNIAWSPNFSDSNNCNGSLAPGRSCRINVRFVPTTTGVLTGTLTITDSDPTSPQVVTLTGTGIAPINYVQPTSLAFGGVPIRTTSAPQVVTVMNTGTAPFTINSIRLGGNNASQFNQTNNCPGSLAAGASCTINVTFRPSSRGNKSANLSVNVAAPATSATVALTGTGQ